MKLVRQMRWLLASGGILLTSAAVAQTDYEICTDLDVSPWSRVNACTRLIEYGDQAHLGELYEYRGRGFLSIGDMTRALDDLRESIRLERVGDAAEHGQEVARTYTLLGLDALEARDPHTAIIGFLRALAIQPENSSAHTDLGWAFLHLGQHEHALASFDVAIKLEPDDASNYEFHGIALSGMGDYEQALDSYDSALAIDANSARAWEWRGEALFALRRRQEAIESFDEALRLDSSRSFSLAMRGASYLLVGEPHEALADLNQSVEIEPMRPSAYRYRALVHCLFGNVNAAVSDNFRRYELSHSEERIHYQRNLSDAGFYAGPLDGESFLEVRDAIQRRADDQCVGSEL